MTRAKSWADLHGWHVERANGTPIFRQIYLQARASVLAQVLKPGTKLPATRELARLLGVSRTSVISAYEQLLAEGFIAGKVGSGTYIAADLPQPIERRPRRRAMAPGKAPAKLPAPRSIDAYIASTAQNDARPFNTGRTLVDARSVSIWRKLTHRVFHSIGPEHLGYGDPAGFIALRQTICDYLQAARAVRAAPEQIVLTAGTQQAIDIAIRVLLKPGDGVWVEDPGYPLTRYALAAAGIKLHPVPVDAQGLNVAAGLRAAPDAAAAFVTPSHQFPLGIVLSMARRLELLAWARASGAWIIEDDYASEFRYGGRPLASLQGLDEAERVIYVGTLNKALFPGLRLGYAVLPHPLLEAFVAARYLMDRQPPSLYQTVVAEFMGEGHFAAHIRRMRLQYRVQRDLLATELTRRAGAHMTVEVPDQGMHLVAYLRPGLSDIEVARAARERGVIAHPLSRLYQSAKPRSALMLGFAGFPKQIILPAAARLAKVIRSFG